MYPYQTCAERVGIPVCLIFTNGKQGDECSHTENDSGEPDRFDDENPPWVKWHSPFQMPRRANRRSCVVRRCAGSARRTGVRPAHGHQMHELGSINVMRLDQSRHVACASSRMSMRTCMSMRTSPEEGIKLHRFAGILPEQFLTEAGRHREAVVAADQRMVIRCFGDDLVGFGQRCFSWALRVALFRPVA